MRLNPDKMKRRDEKVKYRVFSDIEKSNLIGDTELMMNLNVKPQVKIIMMQSM